ncbi:MAG: BadF/BadG/BcrA/BcrD ATPase family protein [Tumebacillaceae bacterium]
MNLYIGIDGGGTKTRTLLADQSGRVLADLITAGSNINHHGWTRTQEILGELFAELRVHVPEGARVAALFLGMAGIDRQEERERMRAWVQSEWPHASVGVENDAVTALVAGTGRREGIVLIAGTGSIAFGVDSRGEQARVGGWGYLIGDEGSGYNIGWKALISVMRAHDGRSDKSLLGEKILARFGIESAEGLIPIVYAPTFTRDQMADLARLVFEAEREGCQTALSILDRAAVDLCELVRVLLDNLHFSEAKVSVALTGGMFHPGSPLIEMVRDRLEERAQVIVSDKPPVAGSLTLAMELSGER